MHGYAQKLSLYEAVNKSVTNYPLIKQRISETEASKAHIKTVNGYRIPSLKLLEEVNMGTANSLPGGYFTFGIIPSVSGSITSQENTNNASGNFAVSYLEWPFYTFGYFNAQKKNAEAAFATSQSVLNSDKYLLTENIISLYLDWVKKYRLWQIEDENLKRSETILNAIKATVNSGLKPGVDSSTANAQFARDRIAYLQAKNDYQNDLVSIAMYTNENADNILPDTSVFTYATNGEAVLQHLYDSVATSNPLIDIYQKQYEQQVATNRVLSKIFMPKVALEGAGWERGSSISPTNNFNSDLSSGISYSRYNYLVGLTFSYNITDIKHQHDELLEGRYNADAKKQALETQQLNMNRLLQQANYAYLSAIDKLKEFPFELRSAREAFGQQSALYKAGLNTLIDVTNAQYILKQTETSYVLAQDDLLQLLYIRAGFNDQLDSFLQQFKK
jgi:outer membrane protein TolC